jgi:hypothetical protein
VFYSIQSPCDTSTSAFYQNKIKTLNKSKPNSTGQQNQSDLALANKPNGVSMTQWLGLARPTVGSPSLITISGPQNQILMHQNSILLSQNLFLNLKLNLRGKD